MDTTTTLKPCPFCGGSNATPVITPLGYTVECDCGATSTHKGTTAEAIAAWSHRPTEQALLEALIEMVQCGSKGVIRQSSIDKARVLIEAAS